MCETGSVFGSRDSSRPGTFVSRISADHHGMEKALPFLVPPGVDVKGFGTW